MSFVNNFNNSNDVIEYNNVNDFECVPCQNPDLFYNCPGFSKNVCFHNFKCQVGECECDHLSRMANFYNLSKNTIKRHRRQQIEAPSSDFGLQKARAATKQRIKDSMKPFDNDTDMAYKPLPATELFEEFINMLQGKFKRDMLEYIVREAKTLPIIDIDFQQEDRTYSKAELDEFSKTIGFDPDNFDIDTLLQHCHNFILNEPIISCSTPMLERDLPNKPMEIDISQQEKPQDYVDNVDLQKEIGKERTPKANNNVHHGTVESPDALCARYAALEVNEIERCELILRTSPDTMASNFFCNDSGSNIQLISLQTLESMGGNRKKIKRKHSNIENSSGQNTLVVGEIEMELYAIQDTTLIFLGSHNFVVIDNPTFKEILLGMSCLNFMKQELRRDPVTKGTFSGVTCPKQKVVKYQYTSNCPSYRMVGVKVDKVLKAKKKSTISFSFPISVAEYVFCSDEMYHSSVWHNKIKINPDKSPSTLCYNDIIKSHIVTIKSFESYKLRKGEDLPNTLGFPNHFDCSCRNDQDDIYLESSCYYTEQRGTSYQGHGVIEESLGNMDLKIGINIDEISKQPVGDEAVLGHLDAQTQKAIREINTKHKGAFNSPDDPIGLFNGKKFDIEFVPGSNFYQPPLNLKGDRAVALDNEIKKLLKAGVIEKATSAGESNIPAFCVGKAKGKALLAQTLGKQEKSYDSWRLVLDMRKANEKMRGHGAVLLPSQDDLLTRMQCAKYVAVADVSSAFHALEYGDETAQKMRFCHRGIHYIFRRVIMGALPSSQMLEQAMLMMFNQHDFETFLKEKQCKQKLILRDLLLIYCDDLILGAPTLEQFYLIYEFMLKQISKFNMKLELKKLKIMQPSTTILGFDFARESNGIMTHCIKQSKVDQFLGLPTPKSKRMLSSYLASSSIYARNIIGVKVLMAPLYLFLRSESNKFEYCHFRALCMLRLMMSLNLKQACMDSSKILAILSDSSMTACHGIVTQFTEEKGNIHLRPIMCSSKVFDKSASKMPSIHKEMTGVINITRQAEHLIRANTAGTFILSDCRPLALALRARSTTIGLTESAIYLSSLPRLQVLHLRGSEIRTCDVYSRLFSFGLASKEKFNKNEAMIFKNEYFGDMTYSIGDLERVIQQHENANYLQVSPIRPGKLTITDFYSLILEKDCESQYFRGLLKGYEFIDKYHSFWRPGIKNPDRMFITEAEFNSYVASGTFKEFREQLDKEGITNDKIFYTVSTEGLVEQRTPSLFVSKGYSLKFERQKNQIIIKITLLPCPKDCHIRPVIGPQIFLQTSYGQLSSADNGSLKLKTPRTEYLDTHGYYDTLYKCDAKHESPRVWTLKIKNCGNAPLSVKPISHYSIPTDHGAKMISNRMSQAMCHNMSLNLSYLSSDDITNPQICQVDDTIMSYYNNDKMTNDGLITSKRPNGSSNNEYEKEVHRSLNTTAVMSLLMIAQASHFGSKHFINFLLEMQQKCQTIKKLIEKINKQNLQPGEHYYYKRYSFLLDKQGLLWAAKGEKKACRLVAPSWFISILIRNLHSGPIHLSNRGMATLITRTFLMIDEELVPGKLHRDPFQLPIDHKREIMSLCTEAANQCIKCLMAKPSTIRSMHGEMRHLETDKPGSVMSFDLLEGLPKTPAPNFYTTILVGMCRASNFVIALPQKSTSQSETLRNFLTIYSIVGSGLTAIETDGSQTFSKVSDFCCARGIMHKRYGPRSATLGLAEAGVRMVRHMLSTAVYDINIENRALWDSVLPDVNHGINNLIVKPGLQNYTRRELFWNAFSNSAQLSSIHISSIYQSLEKLRQHREETISKLAKLNTIPEVAIGNIVLLKRKKNDILPKDGTRAFIPPTGAQLYKIVGLSPLYCRLNSILDNSYRTVARNKITRLDIDQWVQVSNSVPGLLKTIYQAHRFIPGFSTRPAFDKLRDGGMISGEQVDRHIKDCVGDCSLLKDVPIGFIDEADLEEDWDTQIGAKESIPMTNEMGDIDQSGKEPNQSEVPIPSPEPQLPVTSEEDINEFRRITRSMKKKQQEPKSFYQALLHNAIPQSAVLTFTHLLRLPKSKQQKSILGKNRKNRIRKTVSFADHCLVTQFSKAPGTAWISALHKML